MGRYIFNVVTVLSLLICLATGVLWVRANIYLGYSSVGGKGYLWQVDFSPSYVSVKLFKDPRLPAVPFEWSSNTDRIVQWRMSFIDNRNAVAIRIDDEWWAPGLQFYSGRAARHDSLISSQSELEISYWLIVLLTLILPASRLRFRKRPPPGLCSKCGYDLRATPGRCPECGTIPAKGAS